jgi:arsenate reductase
MKNVLVLCTGNSCRSQIAEGYLRQFAGSRAAIYSAGVEVHGVNPKAVETMREDGVNIADQTSNHIDEYRHLSFDFVITVCDSAKERCPFFPTAAQKFHYNFPDPAKATGTPEEVRSQFAAVRDQIRSFCREWAKAYLEKVT